MTANAVDVADVLDQSMQFWLYQESSHTKEPSAFDYNLRIVFADHVQSPVSCITSDTPEQLALKQLLNQRFEVKRNYVLTHGASCELDPGIAIDQSVRAQAAEQIRRPVIDLLVSMGHEHVPKPQR